MVLNGGSLGVDNGGGRAVPNTFNLREASSTVDLTGGNLTTSGVFSNSGALVVQGGGKLDLTGLTGSSFPGNVLVSNATVQVQAR